MCYAKLVIPPDVDCDRKTQNAHNDEVIAVTNLSVQYRMGLAGKMDHLKVCAVEIRSQDVLVPKN